MPVEGELLFRTREELVAEMTTAAVARIPDVYLGDEGILRMILEIVAGVLESVFLAVQIAADDMFVQSANTPALLRWADEFGIPQKPGTLASGNLLFSGQGGTVIGIGAEVAYDAGTGDDPLYFVTTAADTIPNPGAASAPTVVVNVAAGNLNGLYEYGITFVTADGETDLGADSSGVNPATQKVDISAIPLGGPGTTGRNIYRQKNASGVWGLVHSIADNTTTTYTDNIADGSVGGSPPAVSTAESITIAASSEEVGDAYNVGAASITICTDVPDGVTDVTNPAPFAGGTDEEAIEDFRSRLLDRVRIPQTGSAADMKVWAEEDDEVESATVFANDNAGTPTNGHTTVRISGPGGIVPDSTVIARVLADLQSKDFANATIHVTTFTPVSRNVTVTVSPDSNYDVASLTPSVQAAITDYINSIGIGGTVYKAGIIDAVFGLPGVLNVTTTFTDTTHTSTQKPVPGTLTVS